MSDKTESKSFDLETWVTTMPANYDLRAEFQANILPLLHQVRDACIAARMPLLVDVATTQDEVGTGLEALHHFPGADRTPGSMLMAVHALKQETVEMMIVDEAAEKRGMIIQQALDATSEALANATKH